MVNFAYGSNLCRERLLARCPNALDRGIAFVSGYRLEFYGTADAEPDPSASLPCVAWELTPQDERNLDLCEGLNLTPPSYKKVLVDATASDGTRLSGFIYVMTQSRRVRDPRAPTNKYRRLVERGYDERGFDHSSLLRALKNTELA